MSIPTAIQTSYAGCRFRSRLEARWAVFFDHLGIGWEYEPQGYVLSDGSCYLPDFLLDCGTWVEVKGDPKRVDINFLYRAAVDLPAMSAVREEGPRLLILGPVPAPWPIHPDDGDLGWLSLEVDEEGVGQQIVGFGSYRKNQRPWVHCTSEVVPHLPIPRTPSEGWLTPTFDPYESGRPDAYAAARSARFEHGERG